MRKRRGALVGCALILSQLIVACSAIGDTSESEAGTDTSSDTAGSATASTDASGQDVAGQGAADAEATETAERPSAVVGLVNLVSIPALDLAVDGFRSSAEACDTVDIEVIVRDGGGSVEALTPIVEGFLSQDVDLLAAAATPSAVSTFEAVNRRGGTTPVVYAAVTDPFGAQLAVSPGSHQPWITGSQSLPPIAETVDAIQMIVPDAQMIGMVHNPTQSNSALFVAAVREVAQERGLRVELAPIESPDEVGQASADLVDRGVDLLLMPTDGTVVAGVGQMAQVADDNDILLIAGDANTASQGAAIGIGTDYFISGFRAGGIACRVLGGEATPADFDVINIEALGITINETAAEAQGVTIPQSLRDQADILE